VQRNDTIKVQIYRNIAGTGHKVKNEKAGRTVNHVSHKQKQIASDKSSDRKEASYATRQQ